ncbi:MAG TPA: YdeI/OmpD-associated family protein [Bryobacteraceae bacterium]|nr:YdeI/OmpD-associated family protein [Bryobacteraceae bacterium]
MTTTSPAAILLFARPQDWIAWLERNHSSSEGVWLRIARKGSPIQSVTYAEAVEAALCYGWIDALKRPGNQQAWLQRFTPRKSQSIWSKINREKALALIAAGRMHPAGLEHVKRARQDGRWESAYDSPARAAVPGDLEAALNRNARAKKFFATLDRANRYAVLFRIQTARRAETRSRRIQEFVAMLARHEKVHP